VPLKYMISYEAFSIISFEIAGGKIIRS